MLILVRHGQSELNAQGRLAGRVDAPLTELGRRQAAAAAAAVTALGPIERVVSSPLARARATAAEFGLPVEVDERWVELDYGSLDGTPAAEVPAEVWAAWQADPSWRPPGGESLSELGSRVRSAIEEMAARGGRGNTVVVSHVSPIKAAVAWALGVGDEVAWRLYLAPASITSIALAPRPSLHTYNATGHLA